MNSINFFTLSITPKEHPTWRGVLVERYKRKSMNKDLGNWKFLKKKYFVWNWVDFAMTWVRWNFNTFTRLCIKRPVRVDLCLFQCHFDLSLLLVISFTGHGPFSHLFDLMFYPRVKMKNDDLPRWTVIHVVHVIHFVLYLLQPSISNILCHNRFT